MDEAFKRPPLYIWLVNAILARYRVVLCSYAGHVKKRKKRSTPFLPLFSLRGAEQPSLRCVYLFGAYVCARSVSVVARVTRWDAHAHANAPLFMFMFISQTRCAFDHQGPSEAERDSNL